jgi:predicted PurR-regulated permease PerM
MTEISQKKIFKFLLWFVGIIIFFLLVYLLSDLIIIISIAILLAFIFDPFVKILEREGFDRLTGTLMTLIGFGLLLYLILSFIIPKFAYQMNQLIITVKEYSIHEQLAIVEREIYKFIPFFNPGDLTKKFEQFISQQIVGSFDQITTLLSGIVSIVAILLIVPFITFFILKDSQKIFKSIIDIFPNNYFEMSYWILKRITAQLARFVRGWVFDAAFVGIFCGLGFYFIGIENALPLGVIAGLGHLVPYLGPLIGGIPAIIISVIQFGDFSHVPFILLLIITVYAFDNGIIQPYVFSKSVNMHPIVIILLIIAGSQLFGILGMLLAIPTATVIRTAAKEIYFVFKNYKIAKI